MGIYIHDCCDSVLRSLFLGDNELGTKRWWGFEKELHVSGWRSEFPAERTGTQREADSQDAGWGLSHNGDTFAFQGGIIQSYSYDSYRKYDSYGM